MKKSTNGTKTPWGWPGSAWLVVILIVYGRLLLHPSLRPVFPENDIWNHPLRYSVLESLRQGILPLWNPLTAFGMPWLAQFQTAVLYPLTSLFALFGLDAWNAYSLLHLLVYAAGLHFFLRASDVSKFWAGTVSTLSLVTLCAFHHIGSNAPADTMAWIPWVFWGVRRVHDRGPHAGWCLGAVTALQVLAGYPQIVMVTWLCASCYALFLGGAPSLKRSLLPLGGALLATCAQWLPGIEYFGVHAVRRPAMPDNPFHIIPLENLKTLFDPEALAGSGMPDYLRSPSFFYHNLYVGLIPLLAVAAGVLFLRKVRRESRFHLALLAASLAWSFGVLVALFGALRVPYPGVLEASKMWVMVVFFMLASSAKVLNDLVPRPGRWVWALLLLALLDPARAAIFHPLERNLTPRDPVAREASVLVRKNLHGGRLLALADRDEYRRLALSGDWHRDRPVFKHFIPNTNLLDGIPTANGNGSTWPSQGTLNALMYFQNAHPYASGSLLDLLGVDVLHLPERTMPARYPKIGEIDGWGLFENPRSTGERFFFTGEPRYASRKEAFDAFASGRSEPLLDLFLEPGPVSQPPSRKVAPRFNSEGFLVPDPGMAGWLVRTQNALPGWRAWVDGVPAPLFMADGIFQAVPYPKGANLVVLKYEPLSFRLGLFVSLLSLLALMASWMLRSTPRTRRRN